VTILGIGNEFRHDDGVGLIAARRLRLRGFTAEEHGGDMAGLIERWKGISEVIVIDAVRSRAPAGTLHVIDVTSSHLPAGFAHGSTHALGLAEAIELSRALGTLPARIKVVGIEGRDFTPGVGLSPEVEAAVLLLETEIFALIACPREVSPKKAFGKILV
jgi:hydrogenase maturation protease